MKSIPNLGEQELEVLNYIGDHAEVSVREVAQHFEKEKGLARTTILTVMERLRKKGFLTRKQVEGVFQYSVKFEKDQILNQKVSDFVQKTLGGSVSPLFNYFFESKNLTTQEIAQLKALVEKMDGGKND